MTMEIQPSSGSGKGCPVVHDFRPLSTEGDRDQLPVLERARRETPVFYMPDYGMYCVTRYADARAILRDHKRYSTAPYVSPEKNIPDYVTAVMGADYRGAVTADTLLPSSPPKHTRVRRAFQGGWSANNIPRYEEHVRAYANELIDGFVGDKHADLVEQFSGPFVVGVVSDLLGLPKEWRERFRDYTQALFRGPLAVAPSDDEDQLRADWQTIMDFDRSFADYIELRRREPGDDLTSHTLQSNVDDDGNALLTDQEIIRNVQGFAIAGSDTSANAICHAVHLLLTHGHWSTLQADRSLIPNAVEEVFRHHGPVAGVLRQTVTDVEIGDVPIPEGSIVYVSVPSCNRDDEAFTDPDTFDIGRSNLKDHIAFGRGIHLCIGAPLARLELAVALELFMDRLPGLRLRDPDAALAYEPNLIIPKLERFDVEWD